MKISLVAAILIFVVIVFFGIQVKEDFRGSRSFGKKSGGSRWINLIALIIVGISILFHPK
jgi:hypothetical protein